MKIRSLNGFHDILPEQVPLRRRIEETAREVFARFGFAEIRVPLMERTELFARSIGEATDIVEKEMYTFPQQGETLRPEATASILRAFVEHGMHVRAPVQRLFTMGPMFRRERPQKGRLRQFHQIDAEVLGAAEPGLDAEVMAMGAMLLDELGLFASLEINSLGCPECRPAFRKALVDFFSARRERLCPDCARRLERNPLRVLDCKQQGCRAEAEAAPSILESLCAGCADHLDAVRQGLEAQGVGFRLNRFMVRGLDYYCRTTFEFLSGDLGAQAAVGAGGRYDGLVAQLGGPDLPGIGFAMGVERLALLMEQSGQDLPAGPGMDLFIAALGPRAREAAAPLAQALRRGGLRVLMDPAGRGLKSQMKQAGRCRAAHTLILGDNELEAGAGVLRDMDTGGQEEFALRGGPADWAAALAERLAAGD